MLYFRSATAGWASIACIVVNRPLPIPTLGLVWFCVEFVAALDRFSQLFSSRSPVTWNSSWPDPLPLTGRAVGRGCELGMRPNLVGAAASEQCAAAGCTDL
ncbi:hypothetical protein ACH3Y9_13920 [Streptomyces sp. WSLK1-5]|uniref:hypothetical protein n=1 Tax=unclassified Streptomyces TaxID=2593676 RepID=UPI0037AD3548